MEINKKIRAWLEGSQDYEEGLDLLQETGIKKHKVFGKLIKGESKTRHDKLAYLLSKQLGLKEVPKPNQKLQTVTKEKASKPSPEKKDIGKTVEQGKEQKDPEGNESRLSLIGKDENINDYPEEIKKVVIEYSNLYNDRGLAHRKLRELGDSNEAEVVKQRKYLADEIKEKSGKMEDLFKAFEEYKETGNIPEDEEEDETTGNDQPKTIEEMKRLKKNLQASIVKDKNLLLYRTKTKPAGGKENPLPDGPRRIRLEKRVKQKEKEIEKLDLYIAKNE